MRSMLFAAVALLCAAAAPVGAQDRPRYVPTRDVVVRYAVTSDQPGVPPGVVAHISAAGRLRIETQDHGTVLYDLGSQHARWLLPRSNIFVELPVGRSLAGSFLPDSGATFRRAGTATVAGLRCDTWQVTAPRGSGTACVTDGGVILSAEGADARGRGGRLTATSVSFERQPDALFEPPPGSHRLELPRGLTMPISPQPVTPQPVMPQR